VRLKKKPRFFCDNCGCEVNKDTKACPKCGRFFASVRCPSCGFSGEEKLFSGGCPSCGYSAPSDNNNRSAKTAQGSKPAFFTGGRARSWVYFFSIIVLLVIVAVLSFFITR